MRARRDTYTQEVRTQAVVVTYNVGLATPSTQMAEGLRPLLRPHGVSTSRAETDPSGAAGVAGGPAIILVGLQHVVRTHEHSPPQLEPQWDL